MVQFQEGAADASATYSELCFQSINLAMIQSKKYPPASPLKGQRQFLLIYFTIVCRLSCHFVPSGKKEKKIKASQKF